MNFFERAVHWYATWLIWGPRCSEHMVGCGCCEHWAEHDWIFNNAPLDKSPPVA